jgi:NADH-quinone oxidoreductase subunit L
MVKAGVYFVARLAPIFFILPFAEKGDFFTAVALIGGFTALMAASQALVNKELKKVLAYSTVSQIGYMMLAIGVAGLSSSFLEGYVSAVFHLLSHMLFKAGLFMAAGVLIHVTETKYVDQMGGLRSPLKRTFYAFTILALALAGMPPLSGFWSKDAIFASALGPQTLVTDIVYLAASASALLTAFYSIRMVGLAFFGQGREDGELLHDAGLREFSTYGILAGATLIIGFVGPLFESSLFSSLGSYVAAFGVVESGAFSLNLAAVATSLTVFLVGALLAYPFYITRRISPAEAIGKRPILQGIYQFLWHRWYLDALYYKVFANPIRAVSTWGYGAVEQGFFDRLNGGIASGARGLSSAGDWFDRRVVDGFANGLARVAGGLSIRLRKLQTGVAEHYLLFVLLGLLLLLILLSIYTGGVP